MAPLQKIRHLILIHRDELAGREPETFDAAEIDQRWDQVVNDGDHWDAMDDFRCSGIDTNVPCGWSRNYECKSVAAQYADGSWVGWTYYYGGGKHAEPESVPWMEAAYDLTVSEEENLVIVRTFAKAEAA